MAADSNFVFVSAGTITASGTSSALDLKTGTPRRGLKARVTYSGGTANAAATAVYKIQDSADGTTYADLSTNASDSTLALGTAGGASGQFHIPFETSKRYARCVWTLTGGTAPSIIHAVEVTLGRPG